MTHTKESISRELKRIQDAVPKLFRDTLFKESDKTPVVREMFEKVASGEETSANVSKETAQMLLNDGIFHKKHIQENPQVAKQRDIWVGKEIKKSVKEGRLPNKKQLAKLNIEYYGNK